MTQDTATVRVDEAPTPPESTAPERFFNRELSWLAFNTRVLEEASNSRHPLLERLRFLSISAANLDEFYMVRVAGLKGQVRAGINTQSPDGLTPAQQLAAIRETADVLMQEQQNCWLVLRKELRATGIAVIDPCELSKKDHAWLENRFFEQVFPVLTPLAIDPAHPFPFIPNLGFAILLDLLYEGEDRTTQALIPIPHLLERFIRLPDDSSGIRFISLEDVISLFLDSLFPNCTATAQGQFRVIRDSEMEIDEEAEDLVVTFESALKRRKRGNVVMMALNRGIPASLRDPVLDELGGSEDDVSYHDGLLGLADTRKLIVDDR
ncbi:MAG: RNA degradosome polyphosphate kinase, partial [Rhodospirillales bacterium]|nr:RNA degradosome polyphosphate kinase [Rhodospirillales bacterium]